MELLLFPSRATITGRLLPTCPLRRAGATSFRPQSSSGNVEATTDTTATTASVAKNRQEWRAGGTTFGLGLDLSEEMRREMLWRMLTPPAAAVAAEAVFLAVLNSGAAVVDAPAWAGASTAHKFIGQILKNMLTENEVADEISGCYLGGSSNSEDPRVPDTKNPKADIVMNAVQGLLPNLPKSSMDKVRRILDGAGQ